MNLCVDIVDGIKIYNFGCQSIVIEMHVRNVGKKSNDYGPWY